MPRHDHYDAIVVGGGFFGCSLAIELRRRFERVLLLEAGQDFLQRASYVNQARVHNGYHYPRHFLTALRSRVNFPRFVADYQSCIVSDFEKYYAIARKYSKTTAAQFHSFMTRVGSPIAVAPESVRKMFNDDLIENVFSVTEYAFDAVKLKKITEDMLLEVGVEVLFSSKAVKAKRTENDRVELSVLPMCGTNKNPYVVVTKNVFNCTYAQINGLLHASNIELIPLKHEVTEMCLVQLPEQLLGKSVTVMCGPFFSFMPFPALNLTSLSHVRYTPHSHWYDDPGDYFEPYEYFASMPKKTAFPAMIRDVARYIPILSEAKYERSLWELKTTLPSSEYNDGRPILFRHNHGIPGMTCVMGGKIDNIYDVASELKIVLGESLA